MLYHGHTFCGNPIACAAALAALDVFERERVVERGEPTARRMVEGLARLAAGRSEIRQWRAIGMVGMLEIDPAAGGAALAARIGEQARAVGLFLRPLGGSVYLWPPLVTTTEEMDAMLAMLAEAFKQAEK
jgi:adenosylmethionine-8-amino-7-oxononanoate aminotransferase